MFRTPTLPNFSPITTEAICEHAGLKHAPNKYTAEEWDAKIQKTPIQHLIGLRLVTVSASGTLSWTPSAEALYQNIADQVKINWNALGIRH